MKSTKKLIRYLYIYISLPLYIKFNQDYLILAKNNDVSDYFIYYKDKKYPLGNKKQDIEED